MSGGAWVAVRGGTYWMGGSEDDKFTNDTERPRRRIEVASFEMAAFPVTIGEFRVFRPGHEPGTPSAWPAVMVSWDDAAAFCAANGARLPSEAEWEYAARAGALSSYPWGDTIDPSRANYLYTEDGRKVGPGHRTPRGSYAANAYGLYDLTGNVCEWVADAWRPAYDAPADESRRVLRGGAWDYLPRLLRVSWRDGLAAGVRRDNVGFRMAR